MSLLSSFAIQSLHNRLGQTIQLGVSHHQGLGREFVFVTALEQHASSVVAKNAEHFAFQLRELLDLDSRRFEMIEVRGNSENPEFWRWRFEWVGSTPITPKCELVTASNQYVQMMDLLSLQTHPKAASA